jgi:TRAP-type mannitol/chloroaromatic compound transport system permease small subunit
LKSLKSFVEGITRVNEYLGTILSYSIALLLGIVLMEVAFRYIFNIPTQWSFEVILWLYGIPAFLGGGYVLSQKAHVSLDIIYNKFSLRMKAILDLITSIFFFGFVGILAWQGIRFVYQAIEMSERSISSWGPIIWPIKIFIPIGVIFLLLQGIGVFIQNLYSAITGEVLK